MSRLYALPPSSVNGDNPVTYIEALTSREKMLLELVAAGYSNQDIANRESLAICTVKCHLRNIFQKLQVRNRTKAVRVATQLDLIDPNI